MELNDLKNTWKNVATPRTDDAAIKAMLSESNHPVLKGIRKQVVIEVSFWAAFLLCYYTMFDGDTKPVWVNAILILSVLLPLIHNLMGYNFARYLVNGVTLKASLAAYLSNIKMYAAVSVVSRSLFAAGFIVFFTYGLAINQSRYYALALLVIIFAIQLFALNRIWAKRISNLKVTLNNFEL